MKKPSLQRPVPIPDDKLPFTTLRDLTVRIPALGLTRMKWLVYSPHTGIVFVGADNHLYSRSGGGRLMTYQDNPESFVWSGAVLDGLCRAGYVTRAAVAEHRAYLKSVLARRRHQARVSRVEEALRALELELTVRQRAAIKKKGQLRE